MEANQKSKTTGPSTEIEADAYAPRKMSFAENAMMTAKVLGIFGLIGVVLWGIRLWTAPN